MFGLLYALANLGAAAVSGIECMFENEAGKQRGRQRDIGKEIKDGTYYDRKGTERLLSNNERVRFDRLPNGDKVYRYGNYKDSRYGQIYRNLDQEKRDLDFEKNKEVARKTGRTVVLYDKHSITRNEAMNRKYTGSYATGYKYKDINNGKIYVCRHLMVGYYNENMYYRPVKSKEDEKREKTISLWCYFYMDPDKGTLVRVADKQLKYNKICEQNGYPERIVSMEKAHDFMNYFNFYQKKDGWYGPKASDDADFRDKYHMNELFYANQHNQDDNDRFEDWDTKDGHFYIDYYEGKCKDYDLYEFRIRIRRGKSNLLDYHYSSKREEEIKRVGTRLYYTFKNDIEKQKEEHFGIVRWYKEYYEDICKKVILQGVYDSYLDEIDPDTIPKMSEAKYFGNNVDQEFIDACFSEW